MVAIFPRPRAVPRPNIAILPRPQPQPPDPDPQPRSQSPPPAPIPMPPIGPMPPTGPVLPAGQPRRLDLLPDSGSRPVVLDDRDVAPTEAVGHLLVGDLAKATGKTVRAIHLYEDLGLLRPHDRSKGRYRLYSEDSVIRVRWITKLQSLGLSLSEIKELVRDQAGLDSAMFAAARLREVYSTKLQETRAKLRELALLEAELTESLEYLSGCDTSCMPELPTESCQCCHRHKDPADAPDLVAGVRAH